MTAVLPTRAPGVPEITRPHRALTRQVVWFTVLGTSCTLIQLGLYWLLRSAMSAQWANVSSMAVTTVLNTAANRWLTFGIRGPRGATRQQLQSFLLVGLNLAITAGALGLLHAGAPGAPEFTELVVLLAASVVAAALRFVLLRSWVFRPRPGDERDLELTWFAWWHSARLAIAGALNRQG